MLAFHFPPFGQSTGRLRTLSFAGHLEEHGWRPAVLTARPHAYPLIQSESLAEIPPSLQVTRAAGLDLSRLRFLHGVYPRWLATPDRWNTWAVGAILAGVSQVRRARPDLIWATFPIPSAILAGIVISRLTRVPLVVDLRDPMVYEAWPADAWQRRVYGWLERRAVDAARAVVVTTPGACRLYRERYSNLPAERFQVIQNGVEDDCISIAGEAVRPTQSGPITLVHSGLMEHPDRDPSALFAAIGALRRGHALPARGLKVILRATGRDADARRLAALAGVEGIVEIQPHVFRTAALREMCAAHGLLLFQGRACNRQIPAKAYEYLAVRRPVIALVDPAGDTQHLLAQSWGVPYTADMESPADIERVLRRFFADLEKGTEYVPNSSLIEACSRRQRSRELAVLLNAVAG